MKTVPIRVLRRLQTSSRKQVEVLETPSRFILSWRLSL